ncbi:MAG TPA: HYR domain-containing protein, partial [candidate division Zixibacteria bacterium]|nr:HYR domain-containing protein [candidate division Zixibacteria bacterium]
MVWVPSINLQVSDTTPLVCQGEDVCISITATDPDAGNTITITKISGAGTFNPVSGSSPLNAQHCFYPDTSGKYRFIFKATDNSNNSSRDTIVVTVTMEFQPKFYVNNVQIQPVAGCQQDVLTSFCSPKQNWKLLNEYTPHNNLNRYGFYTDLGVGSSRTLIFPGTEGPGARETTMIASNQQVGLWLLNDLNNNGIFDGSDSFLFSERALTAGSGMNEHQWFMVFDVRAYKGTGATYFFNTSTEDITLTGDYDYLIFIDDDHTNANFDHNDMVVGVTEIASPPEVVCPANIVLPNAPGQCGANATFNATCTNSCGSCTVTCTPVSGSFFPVGTTPVKCIATGSTGLKDTCEFTVTINDTQKPTVACQANITTSNTPGQCAAAVSFTATAADNCPGVALVCTPSSGSSFAVGTTTVKCKATDAAGNKDSCQFTV